MKAFLETCLEEANNFKETKMELVEERIEKWSKVLHKNHFLIAILKKRLFDLYKLFPPPEDELELRQFLQVRMHPKITANVLTVKIIDFTCTPIN